MLCYLRPQPARETPTNQLYYVPAGQRWTLTEDTAARALLQQHGGAALQRLRKDHEDKIAELTAAVASLANMNREIENVEVLIRSDMAEQEAIAEADMYTDMDRKKIEKK